MKICIKSPKGFSIIEALISVTVMLIVIIPPIYLSFNLFAASRVLKDKNEAANIAYSGIEIIINYRDSWKNYCDIGGEECDTNSLGFNNFYQDIQSCKRDTPCKIDDNSFKYTTQFFNKNTLARAADLNLRKSDYSDQANTNNNLFLKENKTSSGQYQSVSNYDNEGEDSRFSRVIWFDNKEELAYSDGSDIQADLGVHFYSMVCLYNSKCDPENLYIENAIDWTKTVLLTSYVYR